MKTFMIQPNKIAVKLDKVKLFKNNITLVPIISKDTGKLYKMNFMLNIYLPKKYDINTKLSPRNVNMIFLKNAILNNISDYDRKYMSLSYFDTKKATFIFEKDKWMKDAVNNLSSKKELSKFSRSFKLKIAPPRMILQDMSSEYWGKYILRHFKKYVDDKKKGKEFFRYLIPKEMAKKLERKMANMFDWNYNIQTNKITAVLKSFWVLAIMYSAAKVSKKIINKEAFFNAKVKKNLNIFKNTNYNKYINKNKIF